MSGNESIALRGNMSPLCLSMFPVMMLSTMMSYTQRPPNSTIDTPVFPKHNAFFVVTKSLAKRSIVSTEKSVTLSIYLRLKSRVMTLTCSKPCVLGSSRPRFARTLSTIDLIRPISRNASVFVLIGVSLTFFVVRVLTFTRHVFLSTSPVSLKK